MEAASFSLYLTPTALHYKMKQYACGCCCQNTTTKSIPLDKIQDIELISDCCGVRARLSAAVVSSVFRGIPAVRKI